MKIRKLDSQHDWLFGFGLSHYSKDSDAIYQTLKCRLLSLSHNWFLNYEHGIRWFRYLTKNPDYRSMENEIKKTALSTKGIREIVFFNIDLNVNTRECVITLSYNDCFNEQRELTVNVRDNQ